MEKKRKIESINGVMMKERVYIVPLRDAWKGTYKTRAKRAVSIIINFMRRHMKEEDVKIGQHLNKHIWERGIKNPPRKVKVRALEYNDEVWVELFDKKFPFEEKQEKVKKESKEEEKKEDIKTEVEKKEKTEEKSEKEVKKVEKNKIEEKKAKKAESGKKESYKEKVEKEVKKESEKGTKGKVEKENKEKKAESKKSSGKK